MVNTHTEQHLIVCIYAFILPVLIRKMYIHIFLCVHEFGSGFGSECCVKIQDMFGFNNIPIIASKSIRADIISMIQVNSQNVSCQQF